MKRLWVVLYFIFLSLESAADPAAGLDAAQSEKDCRLFRVFASVWKSHPLGENEGGAWIVNRGDRYDKIDWDYTPQRRTIVWDAPIPKNVIAQVHTHGEHLDPKPSEQDIQIARKLSIPVYVLTRKAVWSAAPDGSLKRLAHGRWYTETKRQCGTEVVDGGM